MTAIEAIDALVSGEHAAGETPHQDRTFVAIVRTAVRVIGSVGTPISHPTTSAQMPLLNGPRRRSNGAVDRQKPEVLIAQTADRRPANWGKLRAPKCVDTTTTFRLEISELKAGLTYKFKPAFLSQ